MSYPFKSDCHHYLVTITLPKVTVTITLPHYLAITFPNLAGRLDKTGAI